MRICVRRVNGRLIEAQSHALAGTLIKNAVRNGFRERDIEEKVISDAEFERTRDTLMPPNPRDRIERRIKNKGNRMVREAAIAALKGEGEIPEDYGQRSG